MLFRSFPVLLACASLSAFAVACSAPSTAEEADVTETSESGLGSLSTMLRSQTALDRTRALDAETGSVNVEYAPAPTEAYVAEHRVAFEAVTFESSAEATEISVAGDFPSSATIVVANDRFEPLAVSRTARSSTADLAAATVRVPAGEGRRFVLVRDPKWVKPMTFEVSVRGSGR